MAAGQNGSLSDSVLSAGPVNLCYFLPLHPTLLSKYLKMFLRGSELLINLSGDVRQRISTKPDRYG